MLNMKQGKNYELRITNYEWGLSQKEKILHSKFFYYSFLAALYLFFASCNNDYTPKPRGFFRISFPKKEYGHYAADCSFEFEYPVYAEIIPDDDPKAERCWFNLEFPTFKGTLHLSYKPLNGNIRKYTEDSRTLAMKHSIKAEAINETPITTANRVYGMMYEIEGNAASSVQFFLTDSSKHFLRGALYFNVAPQADSLAPVIDFISKDIQHFIATFRWK